MSDRHEPGTLIGIVRNPQGAVAWMVPPDGLTEIQQKRTYLQIPALSPFYLPLQPA